MSRFAQIRSAISNRPWQWILYLLFGLYVGLVLHFGLRGALLAFVAIVVFSRFVMPRIRRRPPGSGLSEIGTIEMEIAAWTTPGHPMKFFFGAFILFLVLWLFLLCYEVVTIVESQFRSVGGDSDLALFIEQAVLFAACTRRCTRSIATSGGVCSSPIRDCSRWSIRNVPGRATAPSTNPIRRCVRYDSTLGSKSRGSIGASKVGNMSCT